MLANIEASPKLKNPSIAYSAALLTGATVASQVATALAAVIVARSGGTEGLGLVATTLGINALVSDVLDLGTGVYVARAVAAQQLSVRRSLELLLRKILIYGMVAIAWLVLSLIAGLPLPSRVLPLYLIALGFFLNATAILRARERFALVATLTVIDRILMLAICFCLIIVHVEPALAFAIGLSAGTTLASVAALRFIVFDLDSSSQTDNLRLRDVYRRSLDLGLAGLASDLQVLETPLIAWTSGLQAAGQYSAGSRISGPLGIPWGALAAVLQPRISKPDITFSAAVDEVRRLSHWYLLIALGLVLMAATANWTIPIVYGDQFVHNTPRILQILCLTALLGGINQILFTLLVAKNHEQHLRRVLTTMVPAGLVLTIALSAINGVVAASAGGLAAQALTSCWLIWKCKNLASNAAPTASQE